LPKKNAVALKPGTVAGEHSTHDALHIDSGTADNARRTVQSRMPGYVALLISAAEF
jgi:hypothetical protein